MVGIFATMGPSCEDEGILEAMLVRGMTGIRINMSHATPDDLRERVQTCRAACESVRKECEIVLDLKGAEQRVGWLKKSLILHDGDELILKCKNRKDTLPVLSVPPAVVDNVVPGDRLLVHDGMVTIEVQEELEPEIVLQPEMNAAAHTESERTEKTRTDNCSGLDEAGMMDAAEGTVIRRRFRCRTVCGGKVSSQQSVKIENREIDGPILSGSDLIALDLAAEMGIDGVMLSFVKSAADVLGAKEALRARGLNVRIFSKIETKSGMEHLEEIMRVSEVIIIARGDLGNAMPLWELPGAQKRIAATCVAGGVPFMVATQMLQSMAGRAVPYRAEVMDIYNAVMDGASYVMATGETAVGKYPVEVIEYLSRTVRAAERDLER